MKKGRKKTEGRPNEGKHLREALRKRGSPRERDSRKKIPNGKQPTARE